MEMLQHKDLPLGHDEACLADLQGVGESRALGRTDYSWLARAVSGAIRPSRDRPLWDMAHAIAALGLSAQELIDVALDPGLAHSATLQDRFAPMPCADPKGLTLPNWRISWTGLARVLALAEFLLIADECAGFPLLSEAIGPGLAAEDAPDCARRLASYLGQYRSAHMPLAPIERRFQMLRRFMDGREVQDYDILTFWREGHSESSQFTTVVEHFITYERAAEAMDALNALSDATGLETIENWEDRLAAATLPLVDLPNLRDTLETLAQFDDGPKLLTKSEFEALQSVLTHEPYHRSRPLTVLRAQAFGAVQSGIANRLRRGHGGASVAERITCAEADYQALQERADSLSAHLRRCLTIALALRCGPDTEGLAQQGERALKHMRRAGFDAPRAQLAASIALVDEALATATEALEAHRTALTKLAQATPLAVRLEADRPVFFARFEALYAEASRP